MNYICDVCSKSFLMSSTLEYHLTSHKEKKKNQYVCGMCSYNFCDEKGLRKHFKKHRNDKYIICNDCDLSFQGINKLRRHIRTHSSEKPYSCNHCEKTFRDPNTLNKHSKQVHPKERPYSCNHCLKAFSLPSRLKKHSEIHTKVKEKKYVCKECPKIFINGSELKRHLRTHTLEKPFSCDQCSFAFTEKGSLKRHNRIHTGEKPFSCEKCIKAFSDKSSLTKHIMAVHKGVKRYSCSQCSKTFYDNRRLIRHVKTHTGERPFLCSHCPKTFSQNSNLTIHLRSHTGEKAFPCKQCPMAFSYNAMLKKHSMTHSTINKFSIQVKDNQESTKNEAEIKEKVTAFDVEKKPVVQDSKEVNRIEENKAILKETKEINDAEVDSSGINSMNLAENNLIEKLFTGIKEIVENDNPDNKIENTIEGTVKITNCLENDIEENKEIITKLENKEITSPNSSQIIENTYQDKTIVNWTANATGRSTHTKWLLNQKHEGLVNNMGRDDLKIVTTDNHEIWAKEKENTNVVIKNKIPSISSQDLVLLGKQLFPPLFSVIKKAPPVKTTKIIKVKPPKPVLYCGKRCGSQYVNQSSLENHENVCTFITAGDKKEGLEEEVYDEFVGNENDVALVFVTNNEQVVQCSLCWEFLGRRSLNRHIRSLHGLKVKRIKVVKALDI